MDDSGMNASSKWEQSDHDPFWAFTTFVAFV
jgi:hypothetical protein